MTTEILCLVLAAGKGTRMRSASPKVMHPVAGQPMVAHVLAAADALAPVRRGVVIGPDMEVVTQAVAPWPTVVQQHQAGTADALKTARGIWAGFDGIVLAVYGDTPLITTATLKALAAAVDQPDRPALAVLGFRPDDTTGYGRLVLTQDGHLTAIVEHADADADMRRIGLCNAGMMAFDGRRLGELLDAIGNDNAKGEYYLTDAVAIARAKGYGAVVAEGPVEEAMGINTRAELAKAEAVMQGRLRDRAMNGGATLIDPATVYFSADTVVGRDVTIGPNVVFGPRVVVEDEVEILSFCHFTDAVIRKGAIVGPFARLRPGADIGPGAHIGNFVEVKNTTIGKGSKANHLTYLGDARIGAGTNVGAGTITCNYDGYLKHLTQIGDEVFIGSNTSLVAPVTVGDRSNIAAGSVITRDVAEDALAIERADQTQRPGWAKDYRARKAAEKAARAKTKP
ncbi:MAG: bifunctional UDP-N-acetylglucosamine diphosphorylase/glucosamine-1-phosphate N-acetyltransferase GlmU [Rhodospirillaceae bacterium]|nr:bifunctional UDP-N-acetylglucosamine diphosphorylase/glucosamine-1-phosphate N-acetyltransferase GlmU [Rhodospirillaceae bacterium]